MNGNRPVFSDDNTSVALDQQFQRIFDAEPLFYLMVDVDGRVWGRPAHGATVQDISLTLDDETPTGPLKDVDAAAWTVWSGSTKARVKIRGGKYKIKK